ncbi:MAG: hypothetical protein AAF724_00615 [Pseudomonadota bacterium]
MKLNLLSEAVLSKLRGAVSFETDEDAAQLIADAINTYVELGSYAASGAEFYIKPAPDAPMRRLRLPFEGRGPTNNGSGE